MRGSAVALSVKLPMNSVVCIVRYTLHCTDTIKLNVIFPKLS